MLLELTFIGFARPLEPVSSDAELTNEVIKALPMIGDVDLYNSREDPEFEVEYEVMIDGRCSTCSTPIHSLPHLLNEQGKTRNFFSHLLQGPCIAGKGAHTQRSSCSRRTRVTSSARGRSHS